MDLTKLLKKEKANIESEEQFSQLTQELQTTFLRLLMSSPWLSQWLKQQDDWQGAYDFFLSSCDPARELEKQSSNWQITDEINVMKDLRVWRNKHMARLMARDILELNQVRDTAKTVSDMADVALKCALGWSHAFWVAKEGAPEACPHSDVSQELIVIAMGKHGAQELNLSSDVDLIFAYPCNGETANGRSHEEFFTRVGRKLIHLLDARTSDGFVFRVDMRLRPWGQSGALVSNFKALQNYYLQQGRFWERFAMVKARAVTGHESAHDALDDILQPFVYRRYVDFQAVGALRDLKSKIQTEVRRQNLDRNIKLGTGGIREVEFIAQVFQLIRGGQDEVLQQRGTWPILAELEPLGLLPADVVSELITAYEFLRDLEHRIQAIRDEQTQTLPSDETDIQRLVISKRLNDEAELMSQLTKHRQCVHLHFNHLISEEAQPQNMEVRLPYEQAWTNGAVPETFDSELSDSILEFRLSLSVTRLTGIAKQNLDDFIPSLWAELARHKDGATRFECVRPILESVLRRTSYFTLLTENPIAIVELVKLVPASKWIAKNIQDKPFLLDELTDKASLYRLPSRAELMDELHQQLLRIPEDDLERQMELLRHFRHGRVLRAAACEVSSHLPLMKISDYLAWVAEVVVEQAIALVWRQMVAKHGRPSRADGDWCDTDFGVIAYGKMGGLELSYESDLDLVFLHNASAQGVTEGPKSIENVVFMARLGQKIIHLMSAVTPSGMLYEIDTRLRPSGNSGLLVSSLSAFKKYQNEKAWTWEHQALVRARFIAGDLTIKAAFNAYRQEVLCRNRDIGDLRTDVIEMRQKMMESLSSKAKGKNPDEVFHIKQDRGGIVDLEFLVQFLILAHTTERPELSKWSDNVRSIKALFGAGLISNLEKETWLEAYIELRQQVHHAILDGSDKLLTRDQITPELERVREQITVGWLKYVTGNETSGN
jgi:glutamate-ammonia-ligase adenylyltransferase